ncbi:MAG: hypothetical protein ABI037_12910 [Gemmatimonadales bacterium]
MAPKHPKRQKEVQPDLDPNVAAFDVVAKLTGSKPVQKKKPAKRKSVKTTR